MRKIYDVVNGDKRKAALSAFKKLDYANQKLVGSMAGGLRRSIKEQNHNIVCGPDDSLEIMAAIGRLLVKSQ